ncbi:MAG TPA: hypothetical protein VKU02_23495 [Gemmataceae bacterium]|nr:hypothetical protein [Gemmataceae bacterium]
MTFLRHAAKRILPSKAKRWLSQLQSDYTLTPRLQPCAPPSQDEPSPYLSWVAVPNPLTVLGEKYEPTKRYHNYLPYYWLHFRDIREQVRTVLEIGVETERSVQMWEEFFPNAIVYGLDINPKCQCVESGRVKIFIGDQADHSFLKACLQGMATPPDIIIDDGSHRPDHQIRTFNYLFPRMSDHGIYVIEDMGGCVGDVGLRAVNRLKMLIDKLFYWPPGVPARRWSQMDRFPDSTEWLAKHITGIAFYRWIAFIMRGHNPSDNPYLPVSGEY